MVAAEAEMALPSALLGASKHPSSSRRSSSSSSNNSSSSSSSSGFSAYTEQISGCLTAVAPVFSCSSRIICCARGPHICIYTANTGAPLYTCKGHSSRVNPKP